MGNYFSFNRKETIKDIKDKVFPFSDNDKLSKSAAKFHLEGPDIIKFHEIFRQMDKNGSGYIALENLFQFLDEELTSSLSPYIQRLFALTEKETSDKISFGEWLPALSVYCLYPSERIYSFVFSLIDDDHDGTISKKDMIKFLVQEHYGKKIFPFNYVKAIEILEVERSDKITFEQFKRIQSKIPFLCYPAFRLQSILRSKVINKQFWDNLYFKIRDQESKDQKKQQQDKIQNEIQKKKNQNMEVKAKTFDQNYLKRPINQGYILPLIKGPREPKRRGSDGKIGLNYGNLLDMKPDLQKKEKRSNSILYVKCQIINKQKKKVQIQSDDENQNQQITQNQQNQQNTQQDLPTPKQSQLQQQQTQQAQPQQQSDAQKKSQAVTQDHIVINISKKHETVLQKTVRLKKEQKEKEEKEKKEKQKKEKEKKDKQEKLKNKKIQSIIKQKKTEFKVKDH